MIPSNNPIKHIANVAKNQIVRRYGEEFNGEKIKVVNYLGKELIFSRKEIENLNFFKKTMLLFQKGVWLSKSKIIQYQIEEFIDISRLFKEAALGLTADKKHYALGDGGHFTSQVEHNPNKNETAMGCVSLMAAIVQDLLKSQDLSSKKKRQYKRTLEKIRREITYQMDVNDKVTRDIQFIHGALAVALDYISNEEE